MNSVDDIVLAVELEAFEELEFVACSYYQLAKNYKPDIHDKHTYRTMVVLSQVFDAWFRYCSDIDVDKTMEIYRKYQ